MANQVLCALAFFDTKKYTFRQKLTRPNWPINSKSERFIWVFVVLGIYNFATSMPPPKIVKEISGGLIDEDLT